jgi:hypothetical protein
VHTTTSRRELQSPSSAFPFRRCFRCSGAFGFRLGALLWLQSLLTSPLAPGSSNTSRVLIVASLRFVCRLSSRSRAQSPKANSLSRCRERAMLLNLLNLPQGDSQPDLTDERCKPRATSLLTAELSLHQAPPPTTQDPLHLARRSLFSTPLHLLCRAVSEGVCPRLCGMAVEQTAIPRR